ncbi:MAG: VWA domain-containing protein [Phycisphaerae bacterium]|nr:VWA domain-containing protein [Phycisphaerae bacterium]
MSGRQRALAATAAVVSVLVHGFTAYEVMGLRLSFDAETSLFARDAQQLVAVPVQRLEIGGPGGETAPDVRHQPDRKQDEQALLDSSQQLLDKIDPSDLLEPEREDPLARPDVTPSVPQAPEDPVATVAPPRPVDVAARVLELALPSVALPKFVGPTDTVSIPAPPTGALRPGQLIGPGSLGRVDTVAGTGGSGGHGTGSGRGGPNGGGPLPPPEVQPDPLDQPLDPALLPGLPTAPQVASRAMVLPDIPLINVPLPKPETKKPIHLDDDFDYTLLVSRTAPEVRSGLFGRKRPNPLAGEPAWFEVRIKPRRSLKRLKPLHKNAVWVIDTSASIGKWVAPVKEGISLALDSLNEEDRFNIVMFKDTVSVLSASGHLPATAENIRRARSFLSSAKASGYTDLNRALGNLLVRSMPSDRVYQIMIATDGRATRGAMDPRAILNMITRENDQVAALYGVGIGSRVDRKLLEFLAYRNKGVVLYPKTPADATGAIRTLSGRVRYPLLKSTRFSVVGVDSANLFPRIARDIYQGESFSIFGRFTDKNPVLSMHLKGVSGDQPADFTFKLSFAEAEIGDADLPRRWAFWKLHHLYSQMDDPARAPQVKKQIEALARQYGLTSAY